jgi:hypothetical protein
MATRTKVFIASSSEGLEVAKIVRGLLLQELNDADVKPWTREFELSASYIESLEKASREADFAVLVLTPDDVTTSREAEKLTPRDNVVFELGLFIGSLGRKRCLIVQEQHPDLRLPTDLLGVKTAKFKRSADRDLLKAALELPSFLISERISELGSRHKLSAETLAIHAAARGFYDRIRGAWWERVTVGGESWISSFEIEFDDVYNSVRLRRGRLYDNKEGHLVAHWKSIVVRILKDANKIIYHWEGWYPDSPNERFSGFGEMQFAGSAETRDTIIQGHGKYWNVDETHPDRTVMKSTRIRRILDKTEMSTMTEGNEKDRKALVMRTLRER